MTRRPGRPGERRPPKARPRRLAPPRRARRPALVIVVITIFPEMFEGPLGLSIVGRARERGLVEVRFVNPRDFAAGRHKTVDDRPYGGGPGMVMLAEPLAMAIASARRKGSPVVYLSPQGRPFNQAMAREFAASRRLVLVCGRYEGVDERLLALVDREVSIGDYVLTGGEVPAMVVADAAVRLVPGVLPEGAAASDSFSAGGALEGPQYTRPRVWRGAAVPDVLLSGDHARIGEWRRKAARETTRRKRPDLL